MFVVEDSVVEAEEESFERVLGEFFETGVGDSHINVFPENVGFITFYCKVSTN